MGAGDLIDFQVVGRAVARLGLVKGSEGNLSRFDGRVVRITRTGARLDALGEGDVLEWTPDSQGQGASSDLKKHLWLIREKGARAIVHAHPPGSVPERWKEGEPHGVYAHGLTLEQAFASAVYVSRDWSRPEEPVADDVFTRLVRAVEFEDYRPLRSGGRVHPHGALQLIDQTRLPAKERYLRCGTAEEVAEAIRGLAVRGAPALGIAAAYGMVLAARASEARDREGLMADLESAGRLLVATRPTAVNIGWAVERVLARVRSRGAAEDVEPLRDAVLEEARAIEVEDAEACSAIGRFGAELVPEGAKVLTHCNTGMLCTAGIGTAQGVIYRAHLEGKGVHVWVDETRPVWQGARLTAWELQRLGVPMTLVPDTAAGSLMAAGRVDLVIVGADRISANGDVANKVGTYSLAVLARHHGVPLYVAAPISSVDLSTASGADITIEERDLAEVTAPLGVQVAAPGTPAANPAFDVTPAGLVTAIVTERGVVRPPFGEALRDVVEVRGAS